MTDMTITLPSREERRARQARLWHGAAGIKPAKREVSYFIPNTPFGVSKVRDVAARPRPETVPVLPKYPKTFEDERAWAIVICGFEIPITAATTISVERIQQAVAENFNVERADILSSRRTKDVVLPRHVAMYLARKLTLKSLPEIGRRFGGRDHTTQIAAQRKIARMMLQDAAFDRRVREIAKQLGGCIEKAS